jgi:hypothetical protein
MSDTKKGINTDQIYIIELKDGRKLTSILNMDNEGDPFATNKLANSTITGIVCPQAMIFKLNNGMYDTNKPIISLTPYFDHSKITHLPVGIHFNKSEVVAIIKPSLELQMLIKEAYEK